MSNWDTKFEWNKLLLESQIKVLKEENVKTWGDLKGLVAVALKAKELKKLEKGGQAAGKLAKNLLNLTPAGWIKSGLELGGQLKDLSDVVVNGNELSDEQAEKSELFSAFNIDDGYSELLDDRLETEFFKWMANEIEGKTSADNIPPDADINRYLEKFLEERGDYDETVAKAGSMKKFTDIEMPEEEAEWKKSLKALGKGVFGGLF